MITTLTRTKIRKDTPCACCGKVIEKNNKCYLAGGMKIRNQFVYACTTCGKLPEEEHARLLELEIERYLK